LIEYVHAGRGDMARVQFLATTKQFLFLVLAAFTVVSSSHKVFQAKKRTSVISCSCTADVAPTPSGSSHKVVTKSAECRAGASYVAKNRCCAKAAKPSQHCKFLAPTPSPIMLGDAPDKNCYQPSCAAKGYKCTNVKYGCNVTLSGNDCYYYCNTSTGSECIAMSGGISDDFCSCNTVADCPPASYLAECCYEWRCEPIRHDGPPHTYKGNTCQIWNKGAFGHRFS